MDQNNDVLAKIKVWGQEAVLIDGKGWEMKNDKFKELLNTISGMPFDEYVLDPIESNVMRIINRFNGELIYLRPTPEIDPNKVY